MSLDRTLARIVELIKDDKELHDAILELIRENTEYIKAKKAYRLSRIKYK